MDNRGSRKLAWGASLLLLVTTVVASSTALAQPAPPVGDQYAATPLEIPPAAAGMVRIFIELPDGVATPAVSNKAVVGFVVRVEQGKAFIWVPEILRTEQDPSQFGYTAWVVASDGARRVPVAFHSFHVNFHSIGDLGFGVMLIGNAEQLPPPWKTTPQAPAITDGEEVVLVTDIDDPVAGTPDSVHRIAYSGRLFAEAMQSPPIPRWPVVRFTAAAPSHYGLVLTKDGTPLYYGTSRTGYSKDFSQLLCIEARFIPALLHGSVCDRAAQVVTVQGRLVLKVGYQFKFLFEKPRRFDVSIAAPTTSDPKELSRLMRSIPAVEALPSTTLTSLQPATKEEFVALDSPLQQYRMARPAPHFALLDINSAYWIATADLPSNFDPKLPLFVFISYEGDDGAVHLWTEAIQGVRPTRP